MPAGIEVRRLGDEAEAAALARVLSWAFAVKCGDAPRWIEHFSPQNARVVIRDGQLAGGLFLLPMGQWFGGRSVNMVGVAGVAVAPEHRGRGVGSQLMRAVVTEMAENGAELSTLFPAALSLYRAAGYEPAGSRFEVTLRPSEVGLRDRELPVTTIAEGEERVVEETYRRFASCTSGYLDRSRQMWSRVRKYGDVASTGYAVRRHGAMEGYLYAVEDPPDERGRYRILVTDFVALTTRAARHLLSFLADHRSLATEIRWFGGASSSLLAVLPEATYRVGLVDHFASRVVDVQLALSARGYPPFDTELALEVIDPVLRQNNDKFVLEVSDGQGTVRRGGAADMRIHVRGLAALYTGFASPQALQRAGLIQGDEHSLKVAAALFAGPAPCLPDNF